MLTRPEPVASVPSRVVDYAFVLPYVNWAALLRATVVNQDCEQLKAILACPQASFHPANYGETILLALRQGGSVGMVAELLEILFKDMAAKRISLLPQWWEDIYVEATAGYPFLIRDVVLRYEPPKP